MALMMTVTATPSPKKGRKKANAQNCFYLIGGRKSVEFKKETTKSLYTGLLTAGAMIISAISTLANIHSVEVETGGTSFVYTTNEMQQEAIQEIVTDKEDEKETVNTEAFVSTVKEEGESPLCSLPLISTHVKYFTDYRCYNLWYTPHYRLQQAAYTDEQGFRRFNEDYIVALGSFYSTNIGDRFKVTLDNGRKFTVILGDGKWDADCDSSCMYTPCIDYTGKNAANLLEFIVDEEVIDPNVYQYGSVEKISGFEGDIVEMMYLGRDTSADWNTYEIGE